MDAIAALPSFDDLRRFVRHALSERDHLDPEQTPLFEGLITRGGRVIGLFFQLEGPRLLKTYALWAGEEHRLLFYDSTGLRYAEVRLSESPDPLKIKSAA
jgi:hypothetical protein